MLLLTKTYLRMFKTSVAMSVMFKNIFCFLSHSEVKKPKYLNCTKDFSERP